MKPLTSTGLGVNVKQAKPISGDQADDPRTFVNTLVYLFGKYFSLRSGEEHRELRFSQLEIKLQKDT